MMKSSDDEGGTRVHEFVSMLGWRARAHSTMYKVHGTTRYVHRTSTYIMLCAHSCRPSCRPSGLPVWYSGRAPRSSPVVRVHTCTQRSLEPHTMYTGTRYIVHVAFIHLFIHYPIDIHIVILYWYLDPYIHHFLYLRSTRAHQSPGR